MYHAGLLFALLASGVAQAAPEGRRVIVEAAWRRDMESLATGRYTSDDLELLARTLGSLRDAAALERLAILVNLNEPEVRRAAAFSLGRTPGGAAVLRDRLGVETDRTARAALLRGLGDAGTADDVELLTQALAAPPAERAAAAEALGHLAFRGVDIAPAYGSLVSAVESNLPGVLHLAAFALYRARPSTLEAGLLARLVERRERIGDDAARGWVTAVCMTASADDDRRRLLRAALRGPYPLTRVAALNASRSGDLDVATLRNLAEHPDPWVRSMVSDRPPGAAADLRARLDEDPADSEARAALLSQAAGGGDPRTRSASASALLAHDPRPNELDALLVAGDPVVRELALEHLRDAELWDRLEARRIETNPTARVVWLAAAEAAVDAGWKPSRATLDQVRSWADGTFGVHERARRWLAEHDVVVSAAQRRPGPAALDVDLDHIDRIVAVTVVTTQGPIRITLAPDVAPLTVASFAHLAASDTFDGRDVHRMVPGFVVQTGDTRGDGMGGPGWFLPDELSERPFVEGSLGMARSDPDTAGSQWFLTTASAPHLTGHYTWFGQVTSGLDVARRLAIGDKVLDVIVHRSDE